MDHHVANSKDSMILWIWTLLCQELESIESQIRKDRNLYLNNSEMNSTLCQVREFRKKWTFSTVLITKIKIDVSKWNMTIMMVKLTTYLSYNHFWSNKIFLQKSGMKLKILLMRWGMIYSTIIWQVVGRNFINLS